MIVYITVRAYDSFGAVGGGYRELSRRLARLFGESDFGVSEMAIEVWSETTGPTRRSLESHRRQFHEGTLKLPSARYEGKRQRLKMMYLGPPDLCVARSLIDIGHRERQLSLSEALGDLTSALEVFRPQLTHKPGLDYPGLLDAIRSATPALLGSEPRADSPIPPEPGPVAPPPWWHRFGINWAQYHPDARTLLDEPFYWDPAEDASPHGANNGAWVLRDYRRWRERHPSGDPWEHFFVYFRRFGVLGRLREFRATHPSDWVERDSTIARMHDRNVIALAFAMLKVDGSCKGAVAIAALEALALCQDAATTARLGLIVTDCHREVAARLEAKLRSRGGDLTPDIGGAP